MSKQPWPQPHPTSACRRTAALSHCTKRRGEKREKDRQVKTEREREREREMERDRVKERAAVLAYCKRDASWSSVPGPLFSWRVLLLCGAQAMAFLWSHTVPISFFCGHVQGAPNETSEVQVKSYSWGVLGGEGKDLWEMKVQC